MAINDSSILVGSRGAVFIADAETPLDPELLKTARITDEQIGDYVNIGHTSVDTLPAFSTDGGDASTLDSWLREKVRVSYAAVTGTITVNMLQGDKDTFKLLFNARERADGSLAYGLNKKEQRKALLVLILDQNTGERLAHLIPNLSVAYGSLPTFNQTGFNEYQLSGSLLASTLLAAEGGDNESVATYTPSFFDTAQPAKPVTGVDLTPETASVEVDASTVLKVAFTPSDADDQSYRAVSSDESKATVSTDGLNVTVTGKTATDANKPVTITVTSTDGAHTATARVTVTPKA